MAGHGAAGRGMAGVVGHGSHGVAGRGTAGNSFFKGIRMKIETVSWKQNVPTKGIDPEKAHRALETIRLENEGLTDDAVVAASRPKNHVLHNFFEWNDSAAGVEYRRQQARQLIRSLVVVHADAPQIKTRAYEVAHKARPNAENRTLYSTTEEVLSDPESRDRLIATAIKVAMDFRRRFKNLHELDAIIESIDKVVRNLGVGV